MISARIILDSINPQGKRITTFDLVLPRIVLAELNTHKMLSKNSASSRAIPFRKMLESVQNTPFIPMKWMKEHTGMQGSDYFTDHVDKVALEVNWLKARNAAVEMALALHDQGLTKQMCNRLLEPFLYHRVICTATDYSNFFMLRAHDAAEIHIQHLAYEMLRVYNESNPQKLKAGEWHIPFGDKFETPRLIDIAGHDHDAVEALKIKVAAARCARISYNSFEGKDNYADDLKLFDRLLTGGHMSPFEHIARAENNTNYSGNLCGFTQLRKTFAFENRTEDPRIKPVAL
jgi:hypothetical protein